MTNIFNNNNNVFAESVYFGKPMVGISVFFDQHFNMGIAEKNGYGIRVPLHELSTQKLKEAINNVLGNARSALLVQ